MKTELQPGFVLHVRPYRDTSALVEAFSASHGRIGLVARGVRSQKSRLRGLLQPFRRILLSWSGNGELHTLVGAEEVGPALQLHGEKLISGFYVNELMMRLSHRNDANPQLFACYSSTLERLATEADPRATLRIFEKRLLDALGYGLQLQHDVTAEPIDAASHYRYTIESGAERVRNGATAQGSYAGATLLALASENLRDDVALRESKLLMRSVLNYYLGTKPVRSRELFQQPVGERGSNQI